MAGELAQAVIADRLSGVGILHWQVGGSQVVFLISLLTDLLVGKPSKNTHVYRMKPAVVLDVQDWLERNVRKSPAQRSQQHTHCL